MKICGITNKEDITMAVEAGADALGFVVGVSYSSRNLTLPEAADLVNSVPVFCDSVVVTVPRSLDLVSQIQIHGNGIRISELRDSMSKLRIVRSVPAGLHDTIEVAIEEAKYADAIHLDSIVKSQLGGTGKVHDWRISRLV
ncbi:MAG: phosphoribosylanthranilate isomerase, partial [Nitrososphaerales archaeon]